MAQEQMEVNTVQFMVEKKQEINRRPSITSKERPILTHFIKSGLPPSFLHILTVGSNLILLSY